MCSLNILLTNRTLSYYYIWTYILDYYMNSATELNGIHIVTRDDYKIFFFLIHLSICTFYAFNIVQAESLGRGIPTWKIHTSVGCERIKNTVYILHNSHCSTRMKRPNRGEVPNNYCGRTGVYLSLYIIICV